VNRLHLPLLNVFICVLQIQLDVKVLLGSNPKALVAKEIMDFQATCVIFDK
jgi:hypothetical protein